MSYSAYESVDSSPYANGAEAGTWDPESAQATAHHSAAAQPEATSFDDMFDDATYHAAQSTFYARGHSQMPHGQTHYRGAVTHTTQGLPDDSSSAHWGRLPASPAAAYASSLARASYDFTG